MFVMRPMELDGRMLLDAKEALAIMAWPWDIQAAVYFVISMRRAWHVTECSWNLQ